MEASPTRGSWSTPAGCVGRACDYRAHWSLDAESDVITFTIIAKQSVDRWTGIAFAPDPQMVQIILCSDRLSQLYFASTNRVIVIIAFAVLPAVYRLKIR